MIIETFKKIKSVNRNILFVAVWLTISVLFGFNKTVFNPPLSVHQGAQADRASIAYNFYTISLNFFEPRVMETGTKDGITPAEFPLVGYLAALFYKIFGFHDFWYRFVVWGFMTFGFWCAFEILKNLETEIFTSLIIGCCWYFSTILCYYTNNFLPDIASLSLMLFAINRWILLQKSDSTLNKILFSVASSLACLVKITSLIFVIAIVITEVFLFFTKKKKTTVFSGSLFVFCMVFLWYFYCKNLEKKVGGTYFLMNIEPPKSFDEFLENFKVFFNNWFDKIYNIPQWIFVIFGFAVLFFSKLKNEIKLFTIISICGVLIFYFLMSKQFRFHDYYNITLMPLMLFLMISGYKFLKKLNKFVAVFLIFSICFWGMIDAKNGVRLRYTKANYWYQTFFEPETFEGTNEWLEKNGISKKNKVLVAFDDNPNVMLYMFKRRGYRTFDHPQKYIEEKLEITGNMITHDTSRFFKMYPDTRGNLQLYSEFKNWKLYKTKNGN